jgi:hypothetical protein
MQYATTAIAMPFEVGKTLLQVQWIPREQTDDAEEDKPPETMREEEDVVCISGIPHTTNWTTDQIPS